jgi:hypothetical protein
MRAMITHLVVPRDQLGAIRGDGDGSHRDDLLFGDQFVRAEVRAEVPDLDGAQLIARDELALIRVDDAIVDWRFVIKVALDSRCPAHTTVWTRTLHRREPAHLVSQILSVPSSLPVTSHLPSACQASEVMLAL